MKKEVRNHAIKKPVKRVFCIMGCFSCKPCAIEDSKKSPRERLSNKAVKDRCDINNGGRLVQQGDNFERKREKMEYAVVQQHPRIGSSVPKAMEGEHVAAGWPSWLAGVAGEAIEGWLPRRADSFEMLDKIGQGTYSLVYRARDLEQKKFVALKQVRFDNLDPKSVRFMAREIRILRKLDHPNVIKLEGLVITSRKSCSFLYLVFEYMEHDLVGLKSLPGLKFTEPHIKCYMQQLLSGLDHCHSRGVLHRDIKGSNLLIDNNGILKIADFGLASSFDPNQTQPLTNRVVTRWYRPPELLLGATYYGTAVDLWSTGCIVAELYAGKPILPGTTELDQIHKIFKLCGSPSEDYWRKLKLPHETIFKPQQPYKRRVTETFKDFPAPAIKLIETLLSIDPADRGTSASALKTEFFSIEPLPCDPSNLPKYPPSKESDAKVRYEEARRQGAASSKGQREDPETRNMDPQTHQHKRVSHSGPLNHHCAAREKAGKNQDDAPKISISTLFSDLVAAGGSMLSDDRKEASGSSSKVQVPKLITSFPGSFKEVSESLMQQIQNQKHHHVHASQKEQVKGINKDPNLIGYGSKGYKINYSGPLLVRSTNMDQMLKDHGRQISRGG